MSIFSPSFWNQGDCFHKTLFDFVLHMQRLKSAIYIGLLTLLWLGQSPHTQGQARGNESTLFLSWLCVSHEIFQVRLEKQNKEVQKGDLQMS